MIKSKNILGGFGAWLWLVITIVPIYYIVVTSLRKQSDYFTESPLSIPRNPTLGAYQLVLQNDFLRYFANSVIVTVASVVVTLALALMASYYVARSSTPGAARMLRIFLMGLAIPIQATIIPVYYMIVKMGLYDSLLALVLPSVAFSIPISVLIIVNFLRNIPGELFESMHLDGATDWRMLRSLALPLTRPALMTVAVYVGLNVWNGFLFPLILTQSSSVRVLPLSLWTYQGQFAVNVPAVLAAVTLSALPVLAAYIVGRRQLVSGLTAGFGK